MVSADVRWYSTDIIAIIIAHYDFTPWNRVSADSGLRQQ